MSFRNSFDIFSLFHCFELTLCLPNELSSAKLLVCFNFQSASILLKVGENVVRVSNSVDPDETPSYSGFIRIEAVCIWHFGCDGLAKG